MVYNDEMRKTEKPPSTEKPLENFRLPVEIIDALGEAPSAILPITGKGEANTVLSVSTSKGQFIVRTHPSSDAYRTYIKEEWCISQAARAGIPSAQVIAVGKGDTCSFMIQSQIEGTHAADWSGDMTHVWRELGRYASMINSIEVKGFGESLKDPANGDFVNTWKGIVDWSIDYLFADSFFSDHCILVGRQQDEVLSRLKEMYIWSFDSVLNHGNLAPKNAIIDATQRVHLIDWGTAAAHRAPHLELSEILTWEPHEKYVQAFLDGYGLKRTDVDQIRRDLDTLILLRMLDSIRWASENKPDWKKVDFVEHCLKKLRIG